ncbi:hypothetical protein PIB30_050301 [Stylosanthes scabra]|uniref:Uncharacterized protein n=1 Tax=Stylosanthes scabra TaxID=79078 RepID=A0ABU6ZGE2_9FABA|nr:hypothetical protein [Stylosanthes scabra]
MSSPPASAEADDVAESCVTAALMDLTKTMGSHTEALNASTNVVQAHANAVGEMTQEMRNCSRIVEACLEAFVRPKKAAPFITPESFAGEKPAAEAIEEALEANTTVHNINVVDLSGGPSSDNTCGGSSQQKTGTPPSFPPGLISEWLDDTIMMGSMTQLSGKTCVQSRDVDVDGAFVPPSIRGKLQMRLGEPDGDLGSDSGVRTRSGKKGRMVKHTPEEAKKSGKLRRTIRETVVDLYGYKKIGVVIPWYTKCKFKVLEKYKYSQEQVELVAYIFGERKDPHEVLYKRGTRQMDREDFGTLLPGNEPSDYVMEQIAFKSAWTHSQLQQTSYWSLPIHFSDFVLGGDVTMEDMFSLFKDDLLPRPIYVQMKEILYPSKEVHLYLMVVDIPKTKIWLFDSFGCNDLAQGCIYAATAVATALDHIIRVGFHDTDVLGQRRPLHKWDPEFVLGVPNMGNPYKDKLWILLWLQMENYFAEGTFAKPKSHIDNAANKVRMDTAMALVNDFVNELRLDIKERARKD